MTNLQDFTDNKSCPELSPDAADSVYNSLATQSSQHTASCDLLTHAISFPLLHTLASCSLGEGGQDDSGNDLDFGGSSTAPDLETDLDFDPELGTMTTTVEEETIEILSSCHVESLKSTPTPKKKPRPPVAPATSVKLIARLEDHDPTQVNRKRVVRAVGVVTFLLLLFSVILIGISLNMSKSIDDMVRASRYPPKTDVPKKTNRTFFDDS